MRYVATPALKVIFLILLAVTSGCTTGEEPDSAPFAFDAYRGVNGLLVSPQVIEAKPSAQQTVYLLSAAVSLGEEVKKPDSEQLASLIRTGSDGAEKIWLLGLAGTLYGIGMLNDRDISELDALVDPRGGLAPSADGIGKASDQSRWSSTVKVARACGFSASDCPILERIASASPREAGVVNTEHDAFLALVGSPAAVSSPPVTSPDASTDIRDRLLDAYLQRLRGSGAGRQDLLQVVVGKVGTGEVRRDEVGILWLASELAEPRSAAGDTDLRQLIADIVNDTQDDNGFIEQPAIRMGDPTSTYLWLVLGAVNGEQVTDRQLRDALRIAETEVEDPVLRAFAAGAAQLADPGQSDGPRKSDVEWTRLDIRRSVVLALLKRRLEGATAPYLAEPRESDSFVLAANAVADWVETGEAPSWAAKHVAAWKSLASSPEFSGHTSAEVASVVAALGIVGHPLTGNQIDLLRGQVSSCRMTWLIRESTTDRACDLTASLIWSLEKASREPAHRENLLTG